MDTSAGESEFDIFFGNFGSSDTDKTFSVGINYASKGCGRISQHISFTDKVNMNSVGQLLEYGIRAIQTYTVSNDTGGHTLMVDQLTSMSKRQYRIPYLAYVSGMVQTQSGVGVENVIVTYCHVDRKTGKRDLNHHYCPTATFTTDKLGQWLGEIYVSDISWNNKVENFFIEAFYNQSLSNKRFIEHTFQPVSQNIAVTHLDKSISRVTDTTAISIFGSVQFDPLNMGEGSYFCPFSDVQIMMIQSNGQSISTTSDSNGTFSFSVTQSDTVTIYIPPYNGHEWRSIMSVAGSTSLDLSAPANFYSYTDTASVAVVHDFIYSAITDDGGHWIKVFEKINNLITVNTNQLVVNGVFQQYGTGNVKYVVNGAIYNYYKRLSYKTLFDLYTNFAFTWSDHNNILNKDFKMYSTYTDLQTDTNSWTHCDYNIPYVGYPANCAINKNFTVFNMWTGFTLDTPSSEPQSTEIWIQVFPNAKPYYTDLIKNGDFETLGSNSSDYEAPLGWRLSPNTDSKNVVIKQGSFCGSTIDSTSNSYCGSNYISITNPPNILYGGGINQTINIVAGIYKLF